MKKVLTWLAISASVCGGAAHAADYALDMSHTFVTFEIGHFGASVNRARFDKKEGSIQFDRVAKTGKADVSFEIASVNSGTAMFDQHLQSAEILDAAQFPKARFVSNKFVFKGDKVSEVQGQLTLHGKTQPVTLKAHQFNCYEHPMYKREVCGGDFEATIDRSLFGVNYGIDWGFSKNVNLLIQVEGVKQ